MSQFYIKRLLPFIFIRLSMNKWLDSKHVRPILLKLSGVKIGSHAHIGQNVTFDTLAPDLFDIGDEVVITMNCVLLTHGFKVEKDGDRKWYVGKLTIGNNVFLGAGTVIAKPLTIGSNVTVAAGSVIVNDIPSNCLVAGVPAKVIKRFE